MLSACFVPGRSWGLREQTRSAWPRVWHVSKGANSPSLTLFFKDILSGGTAGLLRVHCSGAR